MWPLILLLQILVLAPSWAGGDKEPTESFPDLPSTVLRGIKGLVPRHCPPTGGKAEPVCARCSNRGICLPFGKCACAAIWSGSPTCDAMPRLANGTDLSEAIPVLKELGPFERSFALEGTLRREPIQTLNLYKDQLDGKGMQFLRRVANTKKNQVLPFQNGKMFRSCAVVSNSGALLLEKWGKEIDKHDAIFRFKKGPTLGYEDHVGECTSYRVVRNDKEARMAPEYANEVVLSHTFISAFRDTCRERWTKQLERPLYSGTVSKFTPRRSARRRPPIPEALLVEQCDSKLVGMREAVGEVLQNAQESGNFYVLNPDFGSYSLSMISKSNLFSPDFTRTDGTGNVNSVGSIGMWLAVHVCAKVQMYGFFLSIDEGVLHHYYDDNNTATTLSARRDSKERHVAMALSSAGVVRLDNPCVTVCRDALPLYNRTDWDSLNKRAKCFVCNPAQDPAALVASFVALICILVSSILLLFTCRRGVQAIIEGRRERRQVAGRFADD